jgi:hypothetical protein
LPAHEPLWHVSTCVQALPSSQGLPFAWLGFEHSPVDVLQVPTAWHWSSAVQVVTVPPPHVPAWQVSPDVQAFPSLQGVPLGLFGFEQTPPEQVPAV